MSAPVHFGVRTMTMPRARIARRRARRLRAGFTRGGLLIVAAGMLAVADGSLASRGLATAWSAALAVTGVMIALTAVRTPAAGGGGELRAGSIRVGLALLVGSLAELLHAVGLVAVAPVHLLLAVCLIVAGASLASTTVDDPSEDESDVVRATRITGAVFLLAGIVRVSLIAMGNVHATLGGLSMLLVVLAGLALALTARATPAVAWERL